MTKKQNRYTEEFRREAVRLLESSGKSVSEIARDLGVLEKNLYRWRKQYQDDAGSASEQAELKAELKRLRRENKILQQERDILKKAISIFTREQS